MLLHVQMEMTLCTFLLRLGHEIDSFSDIYQRICDLDLIYLCVPLLIPHHFDSTFPGFQVQGHL